jgi:ferrous iron transport protein A
MTSMLSLSDAPIGRRFYIQQLGSAPEVCTRLREMGFCENAMVRCISRNGVCLICEVCNTRIGLNSAIAEDIVVSHCD